MSIAIAASGFDARDWADWLPRLRAALPHESIWPLADCPNLAEVDIALAANPAPGSLAALPKLGFIQSLWAGVDRLLADTSVPAHIPLARMVDPAMNIAMAETALWAVLSLQRDFFSYAAQQRQALWLPHPQRRADAFTVTVLGLGQMGAQVAQRLQANGYRVQAWRRAPSAAAVPEGVQLGTGSAALPTLLARTDVLINLLPLTPDTRGVLCAPLFNAMPQGAALVNLARGAHLVEADLLAALAGGHLRHAVLDVFAHEPLPPDHPFWAHPQVTVLPHVAAQTDPATAVQVVADNVTAWRACRVPAHLVDRSRGY
jgi:glyoxylate/hydroxypyruvate reductase A